MIGKKFIESKKQEFEIKEYFRKKFGKGRISNIKIDRTPVGEKIIIFTTKPGIIIGKRGETIGEINGVLRKKFKLENPQIEVAEINNPFFDAQTVADNIASLLERFGPLRFKIIAYRELEKIMKAGALGVEIVLSGKLPSERAKTWRFAYGYLKKTGENKGIVRQAKTTAETNPGTVGVKVSIIPKGTRIPDKIDLSHLKEEIEEEIEEVVEEIKEEEKIEKGEKKKEKKKTIKKKKKEKKKTEEEK
jgi:small subunit ribosomal protein S3